MDNKQTEWNQSYVNRDNFVFYPSEEVIRFVSKYIIKRTGLNEFKPVHLGAGSPKILDVGCGIGRHVFFCQEMGLDAYGVDLSDEAIATAHHWANIKLIPDLSNNIKQGDIQALPWKDGYFDFALSHGVLDSMYYKIAKNAIIDTARVLSKGALFYCDLVSGDDSNHAREYEGEEIMETSHERNTVQTFFNYSSILKLIEGSFEIVECLLIRKENVLRGTYISRYHLVLKRI